MQKQIYLCGFMGAGKTTFLNRLSLSRQIACYDLDNLLLEALQEESVGTVVQKMGWPFYRSLEQEKIAQFLNSSNSFILALGGGALNPLLAQELNKRSILIWLKTPFEICYERILLEGAKRPLLAQGKVALLKLYEEREATYALSYYHLSMEVQEQIQSPVDLLEFIKN